MYFCIIEIYKKWVQSHFLYYIDSIHHTFDNMFVSMQTNLYRFIYNVEYRMKFRRDTEQLFRGQLRHYCL